VITQEIMMYEDMPNRLVGDKWKHRYYGDTAFGRPILGPVENVQAFTQQDFFDHKKALYTKDNLVIVVA
jgi:predicted Zn-dependent peptidase